MTHLNLCALVLTAALAAMAAPKIEKVEPPNWWAQHTLNLVQIPLTGQDLKGSTVTTASSGFQIEVRSSSDDGRYLFICLDIAKILRLGFVPIQVKNASERMQAGRLEGER
jgi:hypothetical protein